MGPEVIAFAILLFGGFAGLIGDDSPDKDVENTSDDPSEGETETPTQPSLLDPPEEEEVVDDVCLYSLGIRVLTKARFPRSSAMMMAPVTMEKLWVVKKLGSYQAEFAPMELTPI